jgi:hypothetical protein
MKMLFAGGVYSLLIFFWMVISLVILIVLYKRLSKQILIVIGTALGSILFTMGTMGFFSGLANVLRSIGNAASMSIPVALNEGISYARIPFTFATVLTVLFFIVMTILIFTKKQPFKKWSVWAGFFIFFLLSFVPAFYRQAMNTKLLRGIGRIMGHGDTIPEQILPIVRGGRMVVITSFAMLIVYLLVAVLASIHKRGRKPGAGVVAEKGETIKTDNGSETESRGNGESENGKT